MGGRGSKSGAKNSAKSNAIPSTTAKSEITKPTETVALPQPETQTAKPKSKMMELLGQRVPNSYVTSLSNEQLLKYTKEGYKQSRALGNRIEASYTRTNELQRKINNLEPLVKRYNDAKDKIELAKARRSLTKHKKIIKDAGVKRHINSRNIIKGLDELERRGINYWKS